MSTAAQDSHPHVRTTAMFWWLLAFTVLEVWVAQTSLQRLVIALALVGLAVVKGALVMSEFMHLRFERRLLVLIAVTPVLLGTALVLGLVPDAVQQAKNQPPRPAVEMDEEPGAAPKAP